MSTYNLQGITTLIYTNVSHRCEICSQRGAWGHGFCLASQFPTQITIQRKHLENATQLFHCLAVFTVLLTYDHVPHLCVNTLFKTTALHAIFHCL